MTKNDDQLMTVRAEVWCLSANDEGIHLVSGSDAWRSEPIKASTDPHWAVQHILGEHDALEAAKIVHSTSWRAEDESVILTYVAALDCPDVAGHWPAAQLVSLALPEVVGNPITHAADDAPTPRYIDVLLHGLRHLRFLLEYDATAAAAFSPAWRRHLESFAPALAGMYAEEHAPEVLNRTG
jgi:aminoglycoside phosphotransferase